MMVVYSWISSFREISIMIIIIIIINKKLVKFIKHNKNYYLKTWRFDLDYIEVETSSF